VLAIFDFLDLKFDLFIGRGLCNLGDHLRFGQKCLKGRPVDVPFVFELTFVAEEIACKLFVWVARRWASAMRVCFETFFESFFLAKNVSSEKRLIYATYSC